MPCGDVISSGVRRVPGIHDQLQSYKPLVQGIMCAVVIGDVSKDPEFYNKPHVPRRFRMGLEVERRTRGEDRDIDAPRHVATWSLTLKDGPFWGSL